MKCPKLITIIFICVSLLVFHSKNAFAAPTVTPILGSTVFGVDLPMVVGSLRITGYTSPNSVVTFLMEGIVVGTQIACPGGDPDICDNTNPGYFDKMFNGLAPGFYNIGIYSVDTSTPNMTTPTINRIIPIQNGQAATPDLLTLPPTIKVEKSPMKRPESQTVSGMARPNANVRVFFNNLNPFTQDQPVDNSGNWTATNPEVLHLGNNFVTAIVQGLGGAISESSKIITFRVDMSADLNLDLAVDIADFSVLMFNYGITTPDNWAADINDDAAVDLADFSIMMFNWTEI